MCEMMHSSELDKLAAALAKAQGKMRAASKDAQNPHLKSSYATLTSVWDAVRGPFAENGLSVSQLLFGPSLVTMLMHESGQWLKSEIAIETPEGNRGVNALQSMGSTLTYLRRYALSAIAGVSVGDEDDDGDSAGDVRVKQPQKRQPAPQVKQTAPEKEKPAAKAKEDDRPYSPETLKAKINGFITNATAKGLYLDKETGELLPVTLHVLGEDAPKLLASKWQEALKGGVEDPEKGYHDSLKWLFGENSASDLKAVQAAAIFKVMFNGGELSWKSQVSDVAKQELVSLASEAKDEIPF